MRGTALVVLLCVFAAIAAHVLSEDARARSLAADEVGQPSECEFGPCDGATSGGSTSTDANTTDATAATQP